MPEILPPEFWDDELNDLFAELLPGMSAAALTGAYNSLQGLIKDYGIGVDWGLVNTAVMVWAKKYTYEMVKGITDTTRAILQETITSWIQSGNPLKDLIDTLQNDPTILGMFGSVRAEMIAVTEVTNAFAAGNTVTWQESGVVDEFEVETAQDDVVCPICIEEQQGGPYKLGDATHTPSFHVRCRCWLRPIVNAAKAALVAALANNKLWIRKFESVTGWSAQS
jgi:SPP1 gp7 family putative phage head morphogenesis protein